MPSALLRGEYDQYSDIDLLAIVDRFDERFDRKKFSIYSIERIRELWEEGNPFAWHLFSESKMIHSSNGKNPIFNLGQPNQYVNGKEDCEKFKLLFLHSKERIFANTKSSTFELSTIFLAIRNFATCFYLAKNKIGIFSRNSARMIDQWSLLLPDRFFEITKNCRVMSTRGIGNAINQDDLKYISSHLETIENWMIFLEKEI